MNNNLINLIVMGIFETLYMVLVSTFFGYLFGLPFGVCLALTDKNGIKANKKIYSVLNFVANVGRSIPFLILLILLIPFTKMLVGKSYGTTATIVPLTISAIPFIGRMVESSLKEVDGGVVEAAQSMGASTWTIIWKVLIGEARVSLIAGATIALGTIIGYSAMAGTVGGGGLGDIAIRYGYYRYETKVMIITVIIIIILVQLFQFLGSAIGKKIDKRAGN